VNDTEHPTQTPTIKAWLILAAVVAVLVVIVFATGWADDDAPPGSRGRAPVSTAAPSPSPSR
jgi:hypothetical protein